MADTHLQAQSDAKGQSLAQQKQTLAQPVRRGGAAGTPAREARDAELLALWKRYKAEPDNQRLREQLILEYLHLVRYVVSRLPMSVPVNVSHEDLMSYGTLGLIEAVERFDVLRGLKFETYAITRIRGSIIDQLRQQDWVPRGVRRRTRELQEAMTRLEEKLGRPANDEELATELGVTKQKLNSMLGESQNLLLSLDERVGYDTSGSPMTIKDTVEDTNSPDPESQAEDNDMQGLLGKAIDTLPEREKLLIALYYHENLTLREIGDILNVSESRVCQLHAQAIVRLRKKLSK